MKYEFLCQKCHKIFLKYMKKGIHIFVQQQVLSLKLISKIL